MPMPIKKQSDQKNMCLNGEHQKNHASKKQDKQAAQKVRISVTIDSNGDDKTEDSSGADGDSEADPPSAKSGKTYIVELSCAGHASNDKESLERDQKIAEIMLEAAIKRLEASKD